MLIVYHIMAIFLGSFSPYFTPYFFSQQYNVSLFDFIHMYNNFITRWYNNTLNAELISRVSMLAELLIIRDGCYLALIYRTAN